LFQGAVKIMLNLTKYNIFKTGLLITAVQFLLSGSCNKDSTRPCALTTPYSFAVTSEFTPQKAVYNVGDTIFLVSTFPKTLTNLISNQQVDYSNSVGIGGVFGLSVLDSVSRQPFAARDSFNISVIVGSISETNITINRNRLFQTNYQETTNYDFKLRLVCKKKGVFMFSCDNLSSVGLRGKDCTNAGFNMTVTNSDKHFDLFQNSLGTPMDALGAKVSYCFRVQ
jgi:hypothetical protein